MHRKNTKGFGDSVMGSGAPSHWESTGAINQITGGFQPDPWQMGPELTTPYKAVPSAGR